MSNGMTSYPHHLHHPLCNVARVALIAVASATLMVVTMVAATPCPVLESGGLMEGVHVFVDCSISWNSVAITTDPTKFLSLFLLNVEWHGGFLQVNGDGSGIKNVHLAIHDSRFTEMTGDVGCVRLSAAGPAENVTIAVTNVSIAAPQGSALSLVGPFASLSDVRISIESSEVTAGQLPGGNSDRGAGAIVLTGTGAEPLHAGAIVISIVDSALSVFGEQRCVAAGLIWGSADAFVGNNIRIVANDSTLSAAASEFAAALAGLTFANSAGSTAVSNAHFAATRSSIECKTAAGRFAVAAGWFAGSWNAVSLAVNASSVALEQVSVETRGKSGVAVAAGFVAFTSNPVSVDILNVTLSFALANVSALTEGAASPGNLGCVGCVAAWSDGNGATCAVSGLRAEAAASNLTAIADQNGAVALGVLLQGGSSANELSAEGVQVEVRDASTIVATARSRTTVMGLGASGGQSVILTASDVAVSLAESFASANSTLGELAACVGIAIYVTGHGLLLAHNVTLHAAESISVAQASQLAVAQGIAGVATASILATLAHTSAGAEGGAVRVFADSVAGALSFLAHSNEVTELNATSASLLATAGADVAATAASSVAAALGIVGRSTSSQIVAVRAKLLSVTAEALVQLKAVSGADATASGGLLVLSAGPVYLVVDGAYMRCTSCVAAALSGEDSSASFGILSGTSGSNPSSMEISDVTVSINNGSVNGSTTVGAAAVAASFVCVGVTSAVTMHRVNLSAVDSRIAANSSLRIAAVLSVASWAQADAASMEVAEVKFLSQRTSLEAASYGNGALVTSVAVHSAAGAGAMTVNEVSALIDDCTLDAEAHEVAVIAGVFGISTSNSVTIAASHWQATMASTSLRCHSRHRWALAAAVWGHGNGDTTVATSDFSVSLFWSQLHTSSGDTGAAVAALVASASASTSVTATDTVFVLHGSTVAASAVSRRVVAMGIVSHCESGVGSIFTNGFTVAALDDSVATARGEGAVVAGGTLVRASGGNTTSYLFKAQFLVRDSVLLAQAPSAPVIALGSGCFALSEGGCKASEGSEINMTSCSSLVHSSEVAVDFLSKSALLDGNRFSQSHRALLSDTVVTLLGSVVTTEFEAPHGNCTNVLPSLAGTGLGHSVVRDSWLNCSGLSLSSVAAPQDLFVSNTTNRTGLAALFDGAEDDSTLGPHTDGACPPLYIPFTGVIPAAPGITTEEPTSATTEGPTTDEPATDTSTTEELTTEAQSAEVATTSTEDVTTSTEDVTTTTEDVTTTTEDVTTTTEDVTTTTEDVTTTTEDVTTTTEDVTTTTEDTMTEDVTTTTEDATTTTEDVTTTTMEDEDEASATERLTTTEESGLTPDVSFPTTETAPVRDIPVVTKVTPATTTVSTTTTPTDADVILPGTYFVLTGQNLEDLPPFVTMGFRLLPVTILNSTTAQIGVANATEVGEEQEDATTPPLSWQQRLRNDAKWTPGALDYLDEVLRNTDTDFGVDPAAAVSGTKDFYAVNYAQLLVSAALLRPPLVATEEVPQSNDHPTRIDVVHLRLDDHSLEIPSFGWFGPVLLPVAKHYGPSNDGTGLVITHATITPPPDVVVPPGFNATDPRSVLELILANANASGPEAQRRAEQLLASGRLNATVVPLLLGADPRDPGATGLHFTALNTRPFAVAAPRLELQPVPADFHDGPQLFVVHDVNHAVGVRYTTELTLAAVAGAVVDGMPHFEFAYNASEVNASRRVVLMLHANMTADDSPSSSPVVVHVKLRLHSTEGAGAIFRQHYLWVLTLRPHAPSRPVEVGMVRRPNYSGTVRIEGVNSSRDATITFSLIDTPVAIVINSTDALCHGVALGYQLTCRLFTRPLTASQRSQPHDARRSGELPALRLAAEIDIFAEAPSFFTLPINVSFLLVDPAPQAATSPIAGTLQLLRSLTPYPPDTGAPANQAAPSEEPPMGGGGVRTPPFENSDRSLRAGAVFEMDGCYGRLHFLLLVFLAYAVVMLARVPYYLLKRRAALRQPGGLSAVPTHDVGLIRGLLPLHVWVGALWPFHFDVCFVQTTQLLVHVLAIFAFASLLLNSLRVYVSADFPRYLLFGACCAAAATALRPFYHIPFTLLRHRRATRRGLPWALVMLSMRRHRRSGWGINSSDSWTEHDTASCTIGGVSHRQARLSISQATMAVMATVDFTDGAAPEAEQHLHACRTTEAAQTSTCISASSGANPHSSDDALETISIADGNARSTTPSGARDVNSADSQHAAAKPSDGDGDVDTAGEKLEGGLTSIAAEDCSVIVDCAHHRHVGFFICFAFTLAFFLLIVYNTSTWCEAEMAELKLVLLVACGLDVALAQPLFVAGVVAYRWISGMDAEMKCDAYPLHQQQLAISNAEAASVLHD